MTIGQQIADDFFSRALAYRTKKYLSRDIDIAFNGLHQALVELANNIREFDLICIEDKHKMPASWSVPAIKAKCILKQIEDGKL